MRLALLTFGVFRAPAEDPVNQGFYDFNDPILEAAENSVGYLGRSGYEGEPGPESWGELTFPRFYVEKGDGWTPSILSLWTNIESAMAFSYSGLHAQALRHGREWFLEPQWPPYVAWWVEDDQRPDWADAARRHEHLHDHGPSAEGFSFKRPFDADGNPTEVDRDLMAAAIRANAERSGT